MSEFQNREVCESTKFYSLHIDPQDKADAVLSLSNGRHSPANPNGDAKYTFTVPASGPSRNHLVVSNKNGNVLNLDPSGNATLNNLHLKGDITFDSAYTGQGVDTVTGGFGINVNSTGVVSLNAVAGSGVNIQRSSTNPVDPNFNRVVISAPGNPYLAGSGISIDAQNRIANNTVAGDNIIVTPQTNGSLKIAATGFAYPYGAGNGIEIDENSNKISSTNTVVGGSGITVTPAANQFNKTSFIVKSAIKAGKDLEYDEATATMSSALTAGPGIFINESSTVSNSGVLTLNGKNGYVNFDAGPGLGRTSSTANGISNQSFYNTGVLSTNGRSGHINFDSADDSIAVTVDVPANKVNLAVVPKQNELTILDYHTNPRIPLSYFVQNQNAVGPNDFNINVADLYKGIGGPDASLLPAVLNMPLYLKSTNGPNGNTADNTTLNIYFDFEDSDWTFFPNVEPHPIDVATKTFKTKLVMPVYHSSGHEGAAASTDSIGFFKTNILLGKSSNKATLPDRKFYLFSYASGNTTISVQTAISHPITLIELDLEFSQQYFSFNETAPRRNYVVKAEINVSAINQDVQDSDDSFNTMSQNTNPYKKYLSLAYAIPPPPPIASMTYSASDLFTLGAVNSVAQFQLAAPVAQYPSLRSGGYLLIKGDKGTNAVGRVEDFPGAQLVDVTIIKVNTLVPNESNFNFTPIDYTDFPAPPASNPENNPAPPPANNI